MRIKPDATIIFINKFAQKFFGFTAGEIVGKSIIGTIVPEIDSKGKELGTLIKDVMKQPQDFQQNENENLRKDGSRCWMAWSNKPVIDDKLIKGMVTYIDTYENLITNISEKLIKEVAGNKPFAILIRGERVKGIHESYTDVPIGEIVALFGTGGFLEIAINHGNASSLLGLRVNDPVMIEVL